MPTYDYQCKACRKKMEIFQSIKEEPKRKCPECGKNALERLIGTGGAIIFKGSGFYQTDYRSESYTKGAESDKPADKAESASGNSKGESKPESKPESRPAETKAESKSGTESKPEPKADKPDKKPKAKSKT
jgi:putative FmdB family regulatory protein